MDGTDGTDGKKKKRNTIAASNTIPFHENHKTANFQKKISSKEYKAVIPW